MASEKGMDKDMPTGEEKKDTNYSTLGYIGAGVGAGVAATGAAAAGVAGYFGGSKDKDQT